MNDDGPDAPVPRRDRGGRMHRADLAWLGSAVLLAVFVALDPLLAFPVFGSDTGEYYRLSSTLLSFGHLPGNSGYGGWGFGYPGFPGLFEVTAATAGATGVGTLAALETVAPVLAALAVVPLFLLYRRLFPNDTIAILAAALSALFMPRMFSVAHPAPLALGDFLVIAALWMFLESRRDARWYLPLVLTAGGLIFTHHLSTYFFAVSAFGLFVLTEIVWPRRWSVRFPLRELVFLAGFVMAAFAFWFDYTGAFSTIVSRGVGGFQFTLPIVEAGAFVLFVLVGLALRWRRKTGVTRRFHVRFPTDRSVLRDALLLLVGIFGGVSLLVVHPLPGTNGQVTAPSAVLFFSPILASVALAAGSRRLVTFSRMGPAGLLWLAAVGFSAMFALAVGLTTISPARHAEYLVIPLGFIVAVAAGRLVGLVRDRSGRPAAIAAALAVVVLVGANAAIAYPPPQDLGGFQEGLTNADAAVWMWTGLAVPPQDAVATDHRVSSMVFGFDGNPATWQSTPQLFEGSNLSLAIGELLSSPAPHGPNAPGAPSYIFPISLVIVDATMRSSGVALDPSQLAEPLSANATAWFQHLPFIVVYENGGTTAYWVDLPSAPG